MPMLICIVPDSYGDYSSIRPCQPAVYERSSPFSTHTPLHFPFATVYCDLPIDNRIIVVIRRCVCVCAVQNNSLLRLRH